MEQLVSIVIPVYNVEHYVERCLKSVMAQTYERIEIIVVDDGSTDSSGEICDKIAKHDTRITVYHKENGGLSDARNYGVEKATGEYITFIDSDDYVSADFIEYLYKMILESKAEVACCPLKRVCTDITIYDKNNKMPKTRVLSGYEATRELLGSLYTILVTACGKLYKSELVKKHSFPVGRKHEDEATTAKYYYEAERVVIGNRKLYAYYQNHESITHTIGKKKNVDAIWSMSHRARFLEEKKEVELAQKAWEKVLVYLIIDSLDNKGRSDEEIFALLNGKSLSRRAKFKYGLYKISPRLYCCAKKMCDVLKSFIKGVLYEKVKRLLAKIEQIISVKEIFEQASKKDGNIILIATPTHGNLGDHAIVYAEHKILKEVFSDKAIIEVPNGHYLSLTKLIQRKVSNNDIIVVDGGGNLGTLWPHEDDKITDIIKRFKNNKIIIFPQTCYYDKSIDNVERIQKNSTAYRSAKDLTVMLRDYASYSFFKENFPFVKAVFVPDVVLSLSPDVASKCRRGVLLCLRNDIEKVIKDDVIKAIMKEADRLGKTVSCTSTVVDYSVIQDNRESELNDKWREFAESELVITDRLHGMIFAAITKTPCIAVDNISKKVSGVYQWIKESKGVLCLDNADVIPSKIEQMLNTEVEINIRDISGIVQAVRG